MKTPSPETITAVKALQTCRVLGDALLTCQSKPSNEVFPGAVRYSVVAEFQSLRDAHEFYGILSEIWQRANEEKAKKERK